MNLDTRDYIKNPPTSDELQQYKRILTQETDGTHFGRNNLRYFYPPAIRHYNSLFPNNHIELIDFRLETIGLKPEVMKLLEAFKTLIHAPNTNEQDILKFINHTPAFHSCIYPCRSFSIWSS